MNQNFFAIKKSWLLKVLFLSHFVNIVLGLITFSICHWVLGLSTDKSVVVTLLATLVMGSIIAIIGTRRLHAPFDAMHSEIIQLHEKVNNSVTTSSSGDQLDQAIIESLPLGFVAFEEGNSKATTNLLAQMLLGLSSESTISKEMVLEKLEQLKSNGRQIELTHWLESAHTSGTEDTIYLPMVEIEKSGKTSAYDIICRYNNKLSGNYGLVLLFIDRTEDYEGLAKQMEFISLAAHELRGPITIMRGLIDIFHDDLSASLDADHNELLIRMGVSAKQLSGYIDTILNVSRIEKQNFEIMRSEVDWLKLLTQSSEDLAVRAKAHHRNLVLQLPESIDTAAVDSTAIGHVIGNLIDNAIKYSKENGKIIVTVKQKDDVIETTVQDFGVGIPASIINNLFTKFYRSHKTEHAVSGTGLGLYLAQTIVEAHGGNIWVRSTEGEGATFGFTLPTYKSVAESLSSSDNKVDGIVRGSHGWIKNHALYRK